MSMSPHAILFLKKNEVAQLLASAWPKVHFSRGARKKRIEVWARVAGVRRADVAMFHDMLFENEICRADGTLDPLADSWLTRHALAGMKFSAQPPATKSP